LQEIKRKEMKLDWQAVAFAGTQIQMLTDMRDAGNLSRKDWIIEVNKILDALEDGTTEL
jgi:hypothetical protein